MIKRKFDFDVVYKGFLYPSISIISNGQQVAYVRADMISPSDFAKIAFELGFTGVIKFMPDKLTKSYNYLDKVIMATRNLNPSNCVYDIQNKDYLYSYLLKFPSFKALSKVSADNKIEFSKKSLENAVENERKFCVAITRKIDNMRSGIIECMPTETHVLGK